MAGPSRRTRTQLSTRGSGSLPTSGPSVLSPRNGPGARSSLSKSFLNPSPIRDLELALGQYEIYRGYLELTAPDRELYLAVGRDVYDNFFEQEAIQVIVERYSLRLIAVNLESEEI